ncbi:MAG TPA: PIN domain-containing protein [Tepidisphaeraceae bacterium]|nr:PIN domain-containing protein [Tepidisphaeraceae bacterium]
MVLHVLRALFILLMGAVGYFLLLQPQQVLGAHTWLTMAIAVGIGVFIVCVDILSPRRKLAVFSGSFLGLLVGVFIAYALSFVVALVIDNYIPAISSDAAVWLGNPAGPYVADPTGLHKTATNRDIVVRNVNLILGVICVYLAISFVLQTKDDFRFIIPYVEFAKKSRGARPILLDTSVLIDGRVNDVAATGILETQLIVPRFVLDELQAVADSADKLKRNRGRRGLEMLTKLRGAPTVDVIVYDHSVHAETDIEGVDQKLLALATQLNARVLTTDFNLNKVAQLRGVQVLNLNDLANALKPVLLPGERMRVHLVKRGEEADQGVGYLDDGTMVVVDHGRPHLNQDVDVLVTSALQTSAGRMIFAKLGDGQTPAAGGARKAPAGAKPESSAPS